MTIRELAPKRPTSRSCPRCRAELRPYRGSSVPLTRRAGPTWNDRIRRHPGQAARRRQIDERIVNEDMSRPSQADQRKTPYPAPRRGATQVEIPPEAAPSRSTPAFKQELAAFEKAFAGRAIAADVMKQQLNDQVKIYAGALPTAGSPAPSSPARPRSPRPRRARCCPRPTRSSRRPAARPRSPPKALAASQEATKLLIFGIGFGVVALGLVLQLADFGAASRAARPPFGSPMEQLAAGDSTVDIPATEEGRDRRHGAHRDRVPRQRSRARAACRYAAEIRCAKPLAHGFLPRDGKLLALDCVIAEHDHGARHAADLVLRFGRGHVDRAVARGELLHRARKAGERPGDAASRSAS